MFSLFSSSTILARTSFFSFITSILGLILRYNLVLSNQRLPPEQSPIGTAKTYQKFPTDTGDSEQTLHSKDSSGYVLYESVHSTEKEAKHLDTTIPQKVNLVQTLYYALFWCATHVKLLPSSLCSHAQNSHLYWNNNTCQNDHTSRKNSPLNKRKEPVLFHDETKIPRKQDDRRIFRRNHDSLSLQEECDEIEQSIYSARSQNQKIRIQTLNKYLNLLGKTKQYEKAESEFETLLPCERDSFTYNTMIRIYADQGKFNKAKNLFASMPKVKRNIVTYNTIIMIEAEQGNFEDAEKIYQTTIKGKPTIVTYNTWLKILGLRKDLQGAKELFYNGIPKPIEKTKKTYNTCLKILLDHKQYQEVKRLYAEIRKKRMCDNITDTIMLQTLISEGKHEQAVKFFISRLQDKYDITPYNIMLQFYLDRYDYPAANELYRRLPKESHDYATHSMRLQLYAAQDNYKSARKFFNNLSNIQKSMPVYLAMSNIIINQITNFTSRSLLPHVKSILDFFKAMTDKLDSYRNHEINYRIDTKKTAYRIYLFVEILQQKISEDESKEYSDTISQLDNLLINLLMTLAGIVEKRPTPDYTWIEACLLRLFLPNNLSIDYEKFTPEFCIDYLMQQWEKFQRAGFHYEDGNGGTAGPSASSPHPSGCDENNHKTSWSLRP